MGRSRRMRSLGCHWNFGSLPRFPSRSSGAHAHPHPHLRLRQGSGSSNCLAWIAFGRFLNPGRFCL